MAAKITDFHAQIEAATEHPTSEQVLGFISEASGVIADPQRQSSKLEIWPQDFLAYGELYAFTFTTAADLTAGVAILFADPRLSGAPMKGTAWNTIIVPDLVKDLWVSQLMDENLSFECDRVKKLSEFPADKAARLRQRAGFAY